MIHCFFRGGPQWELHEFSATTKEEAIKHWREWRTGNYSNHLLMKVTIWVFEVRLERQKITSFCGWTKEHGILERRVKSVAEILAALSCYEIVYLEAYKVKKNKFDLRVGVSTEDINRSNVILAK